MSCPTVPGATLSPDGRLLIESFTGRMRPVPGEGEIHLLTQPRQFGAPFAFSRDARLLAAAADYPGPVRSLRIDELSSRQLLARVEADLGYRPALAFSPDDRLLAAAGADALHVWETASGRRVQQVPAQGRLTGWVPGEFARCLAVAPDGKSVATGYADGTVLVWDLSPARAALVRQAP
jgi:WD40 repeat protein